MERSTLEPHIYLDRSGDLRQDCFYRVDFDEEIGFPGHAGPGEYLVKREPSELELWRRGKPGYFSVMHEPGFELEIEERHDCPSDKSHVTQSWWRALMTKPREPEAIVAPFVAMGGDKLATLIRPDLLESLRKTRLTGWRAAEVTYASQDGEIKGTTREPNGYPSMWYLQFRGKAKRRSKSFRNAKNACPHCGWGPLYCPGCEWSTWHCPRCEDKLNEKSLVQTETAARNPKLYRPGIPLLLEDNESVQRGILEGEHWDGSDFIQISCGWGYGPFTDDRYLLTRRAVDWLVARHAAPLWAVPIPVDVSRMSQKQLRQLEIARDVKTVE